MEVISDQDSEEDVNCPVPRRWKRAPCIKAALAPLFDIDDEGCVIWCH